MRFLRPALFALALFALPSAVSAQYCWDTVCAAGTPAADCWRAWCVDGWSYPAYPYRAPGWYSVPAPVPWSLPGVSVVPQRSAFLQGTEPAPLPALQR